VERAKVRGIWFHDLRHTLRPLLLAGEQVHVVSDRLDHATAVITMSVYAHVLETAASPGRADHRRVDSGREMGVGRAQGPVSMV
jgi:integrase